MGILNAVLGNASKVDLKDIQEEFADYLIDGELIKHAYKLVRDKIIFTNKRVIIVNKQGITGRKKEYMSIPYSKITMFSAESTGRLDLDAELKIWVSGNHTPITLSFSKSVNILEIERILAEIIL